MVLPIIRRRWLLFVAMSADGLPIYFRHFQRLPGSARKPADNAPVDSGDSIETVAEER